MAVRWSRRPVFRLARCFEAREPGGEKRFQLRGLVRRWASVTAIAPVAWGTTYFVTHRFLPADYPLYGAAIRALPAGLLLLLVRRERPHGSWWWKSLVLGTMNMGAFFALVYLAAQTLPTSIASTIMATAPIMMMLFAWAALSDPPQTMHMIGAGVGVGGVCLMLLDGTRAGHVGAELAIRPRA